MLSLSLTRTRTHTKQNIQVRQSDSHSNVELRRLANFPQQFNKNVGHVTNNEMNINIVFFFFRVDPE